MGEVAPGPTLKDFFVEFFKTFQTSDGEYKYRARIAQMPIYKQRSLVVDFDDLLSYSREVASMLVDEPRRVIEEASMAVREVMMVENREYAELYERFTARFRGVPNAIPLRGVRSAHIGKLIVVEGIVTRMSPVKQQLVEAVFKCTRCGEEVRVPQSEEGLAMPPACPNCSKEKRKPSFRLVPEKSKFIDWQKLVLQERPEELPPGQLPRSIEVVLKEDLVDVVRPGDRAAVTGILCVKREGARREAAPLFKVYIDANYVDVSSKEAYDVEITPEDEKVILELSKDPYIREKIVASIAPSIHGYEKIKEAIACLLFGGEPKVFPDGVRVRGDIHILLVGDPGVGKSQILRYVASIAPRGIYTTGKGSTAAGLTAAVVREKSTGDFYLEAGALVLADGGVACIDEFDKMDPRDRVSIHEAMEQQSYHPSVEVLLADGTKVEMGRLVDELMERHRSNVVNGIRCQILPLREPIEVLALDLDSLELRRVRVDRVSRHVAPDEFVEIEFSNGRRVLVTPEHPVFVLREGRLATVPAIEVKVGDMVPGVGELPLERRGEDPPVPAPRPGEGRVPREVLGGPREVVREFLRAAFAKHGEVRRDGAALTAPSRGLAEDYQDLLLRLGVLSNIRRRAEGYEVRVADESLDRFCEEVLGAQDPERGGGVRAPSAAATALSETGAGAGRSREGSRLIPLRVVGVRVVPNDGERRTKWVYDVTVEPYHNFISHGLVLHNTVSIAKAGIVATLNARASILAAANPAFGRYLRYRTIAENIDLPATILSRFDLIFVITDVPNAEEDRKLAAHVVGLHSGDYEVAFKGVIPPQLLRKYVAYARKYVHPRLTEEAKQKIIEFYTEMRSKSENPNSPITITPRQLEALIRLAEAHAKMALSSVVTERDAEAAIELMMYFLQSVGLDVETEAIDIDIVMTGKPMSQREKLVKLMEILRELEERSRDGLVRVGELIDEATSQGLDKEFVERALDHLRREGEIYEPKAGYIKRT